MEFQRILVRATNWVGDAVMSLPALHALRTRYPKAHISILARSWVADLYAREPFCDELIPYDIPKGWSGVPGKLNVARDLRRHAFDCALLFQNAFEAAAVAWLARIPVRIGYDRDARGLLLTHRIRVPSAGETPPHQRFYYLELMKRAGIIGEYPLDAQATLTGSADAAKQGRVAFQKHGFGSRVIGVSPGAAFGSAKRWLPERFAEAAVQIARVRGANVAIFGSKEEAALGENVAAQIRSQNIGATSFAGGTTLRDFIDMAAACELFLTNDSGGMHIASALGVPTAVVFGPTDETATGPAGSRNAVIRHPVECSPCHLRECPIDHRCMTRVSAEFMAESALELLK
jgi:lipopolysaccharide heptosyltransferase II